MAQAPDIKKVQQLAAQGNRVAQYNLGMWMLNRSAGGQVAGEAHRWLLESARQDFAPAQVALGSIYLKLRGQDYNPGRAAFWFEAASRQGSADAQYRLAELRGMSEGVDEDYQLTRKGLEQAAAQDHRSALCQLAYCQDHGIAGDIDAAGATRTWMRAADLGAPRAASNLGWRYRTGFTVKQDPIRALAWYLRAEAADYPGARSAVGELTDQLGKQDIDLARELSAATIDHDEPVARDTGILDFDVRELSRSPRVSLLKRFFTVDECDHLVRLAQPFMQPSRVITQSGKSEAGDVRTSEESPISDQLRDLVVHRLEERMHDLTGTPERHGEPMMVLHYGAGMEYRPHTDYFDPDVEHFQEQLSRGGQRIITIITYLSSVAEGGSTDFPDAGISIEPVKGDAVLFFNTLEDGLPDPLTRHAGTPVIDGDKWLATRWIREWDWREPREYVKPAG
jgi:TPR repeat protein